MILVFVMFTGLNTGLLAQVVSKSLAQFTGTPSYAITTQASHKHFLTLRLDRSSTAAIPWGVKLKFDLRDGSATGTIIKTDSLNVTEDNAHSIVQDLREFTPAGTTTQIVITSITNSGSPPSGIFLESYPSEQQVALAAAIPVLSESAGLITWLPITGATGYELEIVYIDSMNYKDPYDPSDPSDPFKAKTPVRIVLDKNTLSYPVYLNYPSGVLHYRLRAIGTGLIGPSTKWSAKYTYDLSGKAFEENKNWQLVTVFAEHGKRKDVITYFDGALRKRQTLSVLNTDSITIAKDTKYDFESRESIDILPAPIPGSDLHYKDTLHKHDKVVYNNQHYFDPQNIAALDSTAGAGRYYSSLNDFGGYIHRDYTPLGEGYPLSYKQFKNDPTGRVVRAKNVGKVFFSSGEYETQYLYGDASLEELTSLFGVANTGDPRYYQKNVTRDPNGQFSAVYVDNSGKTIATSLLGEKPATLDAVPFTPIPSFPMNLMANNNLDRENGTSIVIKKITNSESTKYSFAYAVTGVNFNHLEEELGMSFCSNCVYALTIKIVGPDGVVRKPDSLVVTSASTLWAVGTDSIFRAQIQKLGNCNPDSFRVDVAFHKTFSQIGEYTISKELTLESGIIDATFYSELDTLIEGVYDSIVDETIREEELAFCSNNCEQYCAAYANGDVNGCMKACQAFVAAQLNEKVPECEFKRNLLMADFAPGGWIYGNRIELTKHTVEGGLVPAGQNPARIYDQWKSDWPEKLLETHEEWCQVEACYKLEESRNWDRAFMSTQKYTDAVTAGYWKPVGQSEFTMSYYIGTSASMPGDLNHDPYFFHPEFGGFRNVSMTFSTAYVFGIPISLFSGYKVKYPYREIMLDWLNHYTVADGGDNSTSSDDRVISLWEFVARKDMVLGAGFDISDIPVCDSTNNVTTEVFAGLNNSNDVPPDLQWTIFKGIYSGLKDKLHRKILAQDNCTHFNNPNAHFKPMPDFTNETEAKNYADDLVHQYCDTLCVGVVKSWLYRLGEICVIPESKLIQVKSLLGNYCQNTCGTNNALVTLTDDILNNDPILQQVQSILGTDCLLDNIAMETPPGDQGGSKKVCTEDCVQSDACVSVIIEHLLNSSEALIPMMAIKGIHSCYAPDPVPDWYWVRDKYRIAGFSPDSKAKCVIVFLGGNSVPASIDLISTAFSIRTGMSLPVGFPVPSDMNFLNMVIDIPTSTGSKDTYPIYVFSSCPWPQECRTAQRPSDVTKEIFQLLQADVKQKQGGKTGVHATLLSWGKDHVKVAQKVSAVKPTVIYLDASGSIIPASKIAGVRELGTESQSTFTLKGYTYTKSTALLTVIDGNNRSRFLKAQRFSNYPSVSPGCKAVYADANGELIPEESIKEIGDALPYFKQPAFKIDGYEYSSFILPLTLKGDGGNKNAYIFTTCIAQQRKIEFDTVFVDRKGATIERDKVANVYVAGTERTPENLVVNGYSPRNVKTNIILADGKSVEAFVFTRLKGNIIVSDGSPNDPPAQTISRSSAQQKCDTVYVRITNGAIVPKEDILEYGESFYPPAVSVESPSPEYRYADKVQIVTTLDENSNLDMFMVAYFTKCPPKKIGCDTLFVDKYENLYAPEYVQIVRSFPGPTSDQRNFSGYTYAGAALIVKTPDGHEKEVLMFTRCTKLPGTECDSLYVDKNGEIIPQKGTRQLDTPVEKPGDPTLADKFSGYGYSGTVVEISIPGKPESQRVYIFISCHAAPCDTLYVEKNGELIAPETIKSVVLPGDVRNTQPSFAREGYKFLGKATKVVTDTGTKEGYMFSNCVKCDSIYVTTDRKKIDRKDWNKIRDKRPDRSSLAFTVPGYTYTQQTGMFPVQGKPSVRVFLFTNCLDSAKCKTIYVLYHDKKTIIDESKIDRIVSSSWDPARIASPVPGYSYMRKIVSIVLKNGRDARAYVFSNCVKDPKPNDEPTKPSGCEIVLVYPNGKRVQIADAESIGDPYVSSSTPTTSVTGFNYAGMKVRVTVRGNKTPIDAFIFTNCPLTTEDDCQESPCINLPGGDIAGPDGDCSTTVKTNVDYEATVISTEDSVGVIQRWDSVYANKCFDQPFGEEFTASYKRMQYHFTLFYYDAAGNLVQTVPPQGVNEVTPGLEPAHRMITTYKHNSRNQIVGQQTPDSDSTNFFYNRFGQLRFTQDAQQKADSKFSYTKYDLQGRIIETGVIAGVNRETIRSSIETAAYPQASSDDLSEIVQTVYDYTDPTLCHGFVIESNLRGRVAVTISRKKETDVICATCYSYDPIGNVKLLHQNITGLGVKRIEYEYDLISNVVNYVYYQRDSVDQFIHRYEYDADNRLTKVFTSRNGMLWDNDARYYYYPHGPLARLELGADSVQGLDYTYTLRGEIKGLNSNTLNPSRDPGKDNVASGPHPGFGADSFGFTLGYFNGDYRPINLYLTDPNRNKFEAAPTGSGMSSQVSDMYNGNISHMVKAIGKLPIHGEVYRYDQLYRLKKSEVHNNIDVTNNQWPAANSNNGDYATTYSYDGNGNILTLTRNATGASKLMDNLTYHYSKDPRGLTLNNQLVHVDETVANATFSDDFDNSVAYTSANPSADIFDYDKNGNLRRDYSSGIQSITWTAFNKIDSISKMPTQGDHLQFLYDGGLNRIAKILKPQSSASNQSTWKRTYYVRDAKGEAIATYAVSASDTILEDVTITSSRRIGLYRFSKSLDSLLLIPSIKRGNKQYELVDQLGNVYVTVGDYRISQNSMMVTSNNYYPGGMLMPGFAINSRLYKYGHGGHEKDDEISGSGNWYSFGDYGYMPRIMRRPGLDPVNNPEQSAYVVYNNNPIYWLDQDGESPISILVKIAAKVGLKKAAKEMIEAQIKKRLAAYMSKGWAKQLGKDALDALDVATSQEWWEYGVELIPWAGDGYGIGKFTKQQVHVAKLINKFEAVASVTAHMAGHAWRKLDFNGNIVGKGADALTKHVDDFNRRGLDQLDEASIVGAVKDVFPDVTSGLKPDGNPYNHLQKVGNAIRGQSKQLAELRKQIDAGKFEGDALEAAEGVYKEVSGRLDRVKDTLREAFKKAKEFEE